MATPTATSAPAPAPASASPARPTHNPWWEFCRRRLLRLLVSVWALVTFAFLIIHLVPGDPARAGLGISASPEVVEERRTALGLDDPLPVQYVRYLGDLLTGDLGTSLADRLPVAETIADRLPNTVALALLAFAAVLLVAVPLGLGTAVLTRGGRKPGTELGFTSGAIVLTAIPDFLLAVVLVYVFAVSTDLLPIARMTGPESFVLPVAALAVGPAAALARILRVETLAVLGQDFVRTARAKRLRPRLVYVRHALPNALTATLTLGGLLLSSLFAGSVLVETVFAWPGLGPEMVDSILVKDYPLVQGIVLVYGGLVLLVNLVVDVLLALADPRSTIRAV